MENTSNSSTYIITISGYHRTIDATYQILVLDYVIKKRPEGEKENAYDVMLKKPMKMKKNTPYSFKLTYLGQCTVICGTGGASSIGDTITVQMPTNQVTFGTNKEQGQYPYFIFRE